MKNIKKNNEMILSNKPFKMIINEYNYNNFISTHWHNEMKINIVLQGSILVMVNGEEIVLKQCEAFFLNKFKLHSYRVIEDNTRYLTISFTDDMLFSKFGCDNLCKYIEKLDENGYIIPNINLDEVLYLYELNKNKITGYEFKLMSYIYSVLFDLTKIYPKQISSIECKTSIKNKERTQAIIGFILDNYKRDFSLTEVSNQLGICKTNICNLFKQETGKSIKEFIHFYRVEKSIEYLLKSENSISDISEKFGFNNACYYTEIFTKVIGESPRSYRNSNKL